MTDPRHRRATSRPGQAAVLALSLGLCLAGPVGAADPFTQRYEHAEQLYGRGDYADALIELQAAYDLRPTPRLLLPIGQAHRKLGHFAEAVRAYERFLAADAAIAPELRARVLSYIAEARALMPRAGAPEPPPAPSVPTTAGSRLGGRPVWRIAVGSVSLGLGLGLVGAGAYGLSLDGGCREEPIAPAVVCEQLYDTAALGIGGVSAGAALAIAGVVLLAVPGRPVVRVAPVTPSGAPGLSLQGAF